MDKVHGAYAMEMDTHWCKGTYVVGEGYPHGVIWLDETTKEDSTIMLINRGDNEYALYVKKEEAKRIPRTSSFINGWKYITSFHDYELEDFAIAILERAVEKDIIVSERKKPEE